MAHSQRNEVSPKVEKRKRFIPIVFVIALIIGFSGGVYYEKRENAKYVATKPEDVDLGSFWRVWQLLHDNYVDKEGLNTKKLLYGAMDGMVKSVGDPYTIFFPPAESKAFQEQIKGKFGGVGIEIGLRDGILTVIAPIKDTPAFKAGLLAGDKILKIDDKSTENINVTEAVSLIRGDPGTSVSLEIMHESSNKIGKYEIVRDIIKIPAVDWKMLDDDTAYLQVIVFSENVNSEFHKAAVEISKSSAKNIVLDLRNNPGGLLDSAVNLASYFLNENMTVTSEREGNGKEKIFKTRKNGLLKGYPIVVLINKGSASASEILAGALHDNRNITLIGETSFGKGSVQDVFDLQEGASLKITFAKWFTPNGTSINNNGIDPNIQIGRTDEDYENKKDPQLDKAIEFLKNL